jgi:adenylate cyclase
MPGVELHATAYANLVRGDYLRRIPINVQVSVVILWGLGLSLALSRLSVRPAVLVAVGAGLGLTAIAIGWQIYGNHWWTWLVPAIVQPALALGLNITYRYAIASRQRKQLRAAFAAYVTPEVAEQVISRGIDLAPGGDECMVTIMFTDVQSFTDISERVTPKELSLMLTHYFEDAANCVLSQQGTVIKFIGDSVLAVWGAPISREDHAAHAVRAALGINQLGQKHYYGHKLITRIGINTGNALVGNLGSRIRFDYTVIGASVNYASRLEGLNKFLGTTFLISESTRLLLDNSFQVRCLGRFVAKGTTSALPVYEVLDWHEKPQPLPPWCDTFGQALAAFQNHDLATAIRLFQQVNRERGGNDGPSAFYLNYIADLSPEHSAKQWAGVVIMTEK